jgi:cell division septation protein DedD
MAKALGPKALLIRRAIHDHPDKGNTALAEILNDSNDRMDDKIKVTANDVAAQKQAMKNGSPTPARTTPAAEKPAAKKPGRKPGATAAARPVASASPVDLIDKTLDLAQQAGGVTALKRLVDRIADMQK